MKRIIANRLDFRSGIATGRLLDPVRSVPRGFGLSIQQYAGWAPSSQDFARHLDISLDELRSSVLPPNGKWFDQRGGPSYILTVSTVTRLFRPQGRLHRQARHVIGVTGFIGKVWLANTLLDMTEVKRIYSADSKAEINSAEQAAREDAGRIAGVRSSFERYGNRLPDFLREKIESIEGDVTQPGLGLEKRR